MIDKLELKQHYKENVVGIVRGIIDPDGFRKDEIKTNVSLFSDGLGLDSIDVVELVSQIEETFNIKIEDYSKLRTIDDIADYLVNNNVNG